MMLRPLLTALALAFAAPAFADVKITEVTSPLGMKAWLSEDHGIPFVALEIRFRGGSSLDAPEKAGATNLMMALIEEGTGDLDSYGFADARDSLAAQMSFSAGTDWVAISAQMLSENRSEAAKLLASAVTKPRFDAEAIERVRAQVLANLRAGEKDPSTLAARAFNAMAFGGHPYGREGDGTVETVSSLNREDILDAHRNSLARENVFIAAAGDITAEELGLLIDEVLGGLPQKGPKLPGKAPWNLTPGVTVVDFPAPQSTVLFGDLGIHQDDPDFFAAFILNEAMGGGGSARLMKEVRSKRGLTYGIYSYLAGYEEADVMQGQFSASNDKVAEAIEVIRAEWAKIAAEGLPEEELARVKTYLTGAYPLRFDGNGAKAGILAGMQMQGMPIDYPNSRNAKIEAVTMADIKRVAARLYRPDQLRFVIVGQPTGVTSSE